MRFGFRRTIQEPAKATSRRAVLDSGLIEMLSTARRNEISSPWVNAVGCHVHSGEGTFDRTSRRGRCFVRRETVFDSATGWDHLVGQAEWRTFLFVWRLLREH